MNFIDLIIIICLISGVVIGFKKGIIKTLVELIGSVAILILSYSLKDILANWMMKNLPFFNYAGSFQNISAINIIVYQVIAFIIIFIILYCILGILINISGILEKVLKMTIVFALPSKILGAIVGFFEGLIAAFIIIFVLFHLSLTNKYVMDSKMGVSLLEKTPIVGSFTMKTTKSIKDINVLIKKYDNSKNKDELNTEVLSTLIHYNIISKEDANALVESDKIDLENVKFN